MRTPERPTSRRPRHPWAELGQEEQLEAPASPVRRLALLGAWVALLVAVIVGFVGLGQGTMAAPAVTDPGSWAEWAAARTAPEAAFAIVRLGVVVVAGYLLLVTVLAVAATVWQGRGLVSVVEILTFPAVRRVVHGMVGVSMAGASIAAVGAGPTAAPVSPTTADVQLARADRSIAPTVGAEVMYRLDVDGDVNDDAPVMRLVHEHEDEPSTGREGVAEEWVVAPGDHLWSISEKRVAHAGVEADDAAVAAYSDALIEANLDRLADAGNPDLLYPGQVLVLPPVVP